MGFCGGLGGDGGGGSGGGCGLDVFVARRWIRRRDIIAAVRKPRRSMAYIDLEQGGLRREFGNDWGFSKGLSSVLFLG